MATDTDTASAAGRTLVQKRWTRPDVVERRVDSLAEVIREKIDRLPPLSPEQRERLAALLRPERGGGDG